MNKNNRNSALWLSLLLNAALITALFIVCIEYKSNIEYLEGQFAMQAQQLTEMSRYAADAELALEALSQDADKADAEEQQIVDSSETTVTSAATTTTTTTATTTTKKTTTSYRKTTTKATTTTTAATTTTTTPTTAPTGDNDASTPDSWTDPI